MRLEASKILEIEDLDKNTKLEGRLSERAWELMQHEAISKALPTRILIYCNRRKVAENVAESLRKQTRREDFTVEVILFVGGRRIHERQGAARQLFANGLIAGNDVVPKVPVFVIATSAGEVGVDLDADQMVCDLVEWERMVQRLGRVNRRGLHISKVLVIDQGPPDKKQAGEAAVLRHQSVRLLLENLPMDEMGGHNASPSALVALGKDPNWKKHIAEATTPSPLYPALTRPLIDAWAMTSLVDHTGRPEPKRWLRGWVDDPPQTTLIWRHFLPIKFVGTGSSTRILEEVSDDIEAFFDAAPLQTVELLETETGRVVDWLKKRAGRLIKDVNAFEAQHNLVESRAEDNDNSTAAAADGRGDLRAPLSSHSPIAFLMNARGKFEDTLSLSLAARSNTRELNQKLAGRRLIVDARLKGLDDGLLDTNTNNPVPTIDNDWCNSEHPDDSPTIRARLLSDSARNRLASGRKEAQRDTENAPDAWYETFSLPIQISPDGDSTESWLVVEKQLVAITDEEARAIAPTNQTLQEHLAQVELAVTRIAEALELTRNDQAMLVAAARYHDVGKQAPRWQRAFNAPHHGGPYAKTAGPLNRKLLNGYRHEFFSMLNAEESSLDGFDLSDLRFDLALHLIAAHHGGARPIIGIEGCDTLPPTAAGYKAREAALRFNRLQRQWGPWGLAWWEALLRSADWQASSSRDEMVSRDQSKRYSANRSSKRPGENQPNVPATGMKAEN